MKNRICLVEVHVVKIIGDRIYYLALKRSADEKYPNVWQPVTGHVGEKEKAFCAAAREVKEETGLDTEKIFIVPNVNQYYNHEKDEICDIPVFLCLADENFEPSLSAEHSKYEWLCAKNIKELFAWHGQRNSVDLIEEYLSEKKSNLFFAEINNSACR